MYTETNMKFYTTLEVLADAAAESPLGRATRVWKVTDDAGNAHVLKDVWLDSNRMEEHSIQQAILEDVQCMKNGQRFVEVLKNYMFTPIAYGKVCIDNVEDDTTEVMLDGYNPAELVTVPLITPAPTATAKSRSMGLSTPTVGDTLYHLPRYHYRILFEEYATTIYEEQSLDDIFHAIAEVIKALWIIHMAGWVHRDVSGGNIYWYDKRQKGLIGDFEYAKRRTDSNKHDVRTANNRPVTASTHPSPPGNIVPFYHNPLHDLESVWCIIIYFLFFNEDAESLSTAPETRQHEMDRLFNGQLENMPLNFLKGPEGLHGAKRYLSSTFGHVLDLLEDFRTCLKTACRQSEKNHPLKIDELHCCIHNLLLDPVLQNPTYMERLWTIKLFPVKVTAPKRKGDTEVDERPGKRSRTSVSNEINRRKSASQSGKRNGNTSRLTLRALGKCRCCVPPNQEVEIEPAFLHYYM
ncbi:hypothetical protein J3R30DRAFT_3405839 [Lentinula aciculospora]|uniref:Fungal-type protein kinase domain-containing protein n=1 Tax=Lentinula aciculospora TaxID=153920 RepID=A0A9W9DM44_9AGAR|nr:hypothetical protein J3R30DRAFT_3405839 [Lentinula aciculospora]